MTPESQGESETEKVKEENGKEEGSRQVQVKNQNGSKEAPAMSKDDRGDTNERKGTSKEADRGATDDQSEGNATPDGTPWPHVLSQEKRIGRIEPELKMLKV